MEIIGPLAATEGAAAFAACVVALLERYADEVVEAYALCPHIARTARFGDVVVVLDRALDIELAVGAIRATAARVVHVMFPCIPRSAAPAFERFCNHVAERLRSDPRAFVHAAFHPAMAGGREDADRRIGLVRRAPDPVLQLVPAGHAPTRGTVADTALDPVLARIAELHAARGCVELGRSAP